MYQQCRLRRGNTYTVSWIPAQFAVVGKVLKLKDNNDVWVDGWIVESAGAVVDYLPDTHNAGRDHRDRTGDNLPKQKRKNVRR